MSNQLKSRKLGIVLTLFTVLMLGSCGKKAEESASTSPTPETTTAISQASPGSIKKTSPAAGNPTTPSSKSPISGENKTAVLAAAQKLGVKPQSETSCPSDALIKGKITKKRGNIYHIPKSLDYEKVKPDICFKDAATAQQAGFRAPK